MVIGAGAAGLMAALHAGRAGADVVLVERTADGGRKILISGGGRCNVLPGRAEPGRYVTDSSPNTLRRMLASWPLEEQRAFFEHELGMAMVLEEETGKLFPASNRARDVRDGLVAAVRAAGVRTWFGSSVTGLAPEAEATALTAPTGAEGSGAPDVRASWVVRVAPGAPHEGGATPAPEEHHVAAVILATGGLSVPRTGSDGTGLRLVEALGHTVHATYPALTPLTADPPPHGELAGISLVVRLDAPGARPRFTTTDGFLFTHRGWSGPAVLDASHLAVRSAMAGEHQQLRVRWVPALDR
ncbi:MAG: NAD(P)/FAD-dependent oxidoreductase, partial [Gemmatimonadota bacterium]